MQVNRGMSACQYAVHQSLTVFPEISADMLEIATLGVILGPTHDSCERESGWCEHWAIMCMQPAAGVGGKMVQCISCLWRRVSAIRIHCNYHRSGILS